MAQDPGKQDMGQWRQSHGGACVPVAFRLDEVSRNGLRRGDGPRIEASSGGRGGGRLVCSHAAYFGIQLYISQRMWGRQGTLSVAHGGVEWVRVFLRGLVSP